MDMFAILDLLLKMDNPSLPELERVLNVSAVPDKSQNPLTPVYYARYKAFCAPCGKAGYDIGMAFPLKGATAGPHVGFSFKELENLNLKQVSAALGKAEEAFTLNHGNPPDLEARYKFGDKIVWIGFKSSGAPLDEDLEGFSVEWPLAAPSR